jgi:cobalt-zinc-cadmium efflux system outer membrane protein
MVSCGASAPLTRHEVHFTSRAFARAARFHMVHEGRALVCSVLCVIGAAAGAYAQTAPVASTMAWPDVKARFVATNPTLQAGQIGIDESKAGEVTAFLRPNPQLSLTLDQIGHNDDGKPLADANPTSVLSYLHERDGKRELRRDSAQGATAIAVSDQADLTRTLLFTLRSDFVQILQAKAFMALAQDNLASYDQVLTLSRERLTAGDIAQMDFDRLALQRVNYESDVQTATVNLRSAKIHLLALLNDRTTSAEQFDVSGSFDFSVSTQPLADLRQLALQTRPDLRSALAAVDKAQTDHRLALANGAVDPTFAIDAGFPAVSQAWNSYSPPLREYVGVGVSIPLRIFDKNQGEKLRTELDVSRNQKLVDAAQVQVFADVDSAYAALVSTIALLQPYRNQYLDQATRVRDAVSFSYQRGGVSLVDFLQSQSEYRAIQIAYVNLVGTYLNNVNQLNLAIGQEAIQ